MRGLIIASAENARKDEWVNLAPPSIAARMTKRTQREMSMLIDTAKKILACLQHIEP